LQNLGLRRTLASRQGFLLWYIPRKGGGGPLPAMTADEFRRTANVVDIFFGR